MLAFMALVELTALEFVISGIATTGTNKTA